MIFTMFASVKSRAFFFAWLVSTCYAQANLWGDSIIQSSNKIDSPQILFPDKDFKSDRQEVINFALEELNQASTLPYKEKVEEVIDFQERASNGFLYYIKLLLAQSHCRKDDSTCRSTSNPSRKEKRHDKRRSPYAVPFIAPLESPLTPGKHIRVKGMIPMYSEQFIINIQTGSEADPISAPLSISVPFTKYGNVVKIRHYNQGWREEENLLQVFGPGRNFDIVITCHADKFEISNYGNVFANYYHRIPYQNADHVSVLGMVELTEVSGVVSVPQVQRAPSTRNAPYVIPLENLPLKRGSKIVISGFVPLDGLRFNVNLQNGPEETATTRAFHLDFRYGYGHYIAWNTYSYGWQKEEDYGGMAWLKRGQPFQMEINCEDSQFHVKYHGVWDMDLNYRLPLDSVTHIRIDGDIEIHSVTQTDVGSPVIIQPGNGDTSVAKMRVCSMTVWSIPRKSEMWLNNLVCSSDPSQMNSAPRIDGNSRR